MSRNITWCHTAKQHLEESSDQVLWSLQVQAENVSQVSTSELLVHRTLIKFQCVCVIFGVLNHGGSINRINVHHTKGSKQNFRGRLREPAVSSIPPSAIQEQAMHVDSFRWRWRHIFFYHLSDVIGKCNVIEVTTLCQKNILPQDFALESKPRLFFFFIYNSLWIKILCALRSYFKGFYMDLTTWAPYLVVACLSFVPFPSEYLITCRLITRKRHVMETFGHERITWKFDKQ